MNWDRFPEEILASIFTLLLPSAKSFCAVASTCRNWRKLLIQPTFHIHTIHFDDFAKAHRSPTDCYSLFCESVVQVVLAYGEIEYLKVLFPLGCSHNAVFNWLGQPSFAALESLILHEEDTPERKFNPHNWHLLSLLPKLANLHLQNYIIDIPTDVLEGAELLDDVSNNRSGIKPCDGFENVKLSNLKNLTLKSVEVISDSVQALLEHICTSLEELTLEFTFQRIGIDPNIESMGVMNISGVNLTSLKTVGPSFPTMLCLKSPMLGTLTCANYCMVQFDTCAQLEMMALQSGMDICMEFGNGAANLCIQGEDWLVEFVVLVMDCCSEAKSLKIDFQLQEEKPLTLEILSNFIELQTLSIGGSVMKYWVAGLYNPLEAELLLPRLQEIKVEFIPHGGVEVLACLLKASPSLESLIVSSCHVDTSALLEHLFLDFSNVACKLL